MAGGHIVKPRARESACWGIAQPAATGLELAAGQGQISGADTRQTPAWPQRGKQLPETVGGGGFGGDLRITHQGRQAILQRWIEGLCSRQGGSQAEDAQGIAGGGFQGLAPVGLQLGQQRLPEGLRVGMAPLLVAGGPVLRLLPLRAGGAGGIRGWGGPEAPGIGHQGQGWIELIGFQQGQIGLAAITEQQPGAGQLQSACGIPTRSGAALLGGSGQGCGGAAAGQL